MMPHTEKQMRIGLLGGSFNPAHKGHRELSLLAMKRLKLDFVWWLVTPGNPLKSHAELKPLSERCEMARKLSNHPRIIVSDMEAHFNTRFTVDTLSLLKAKKPDVDFVFLMGADNLRQFHKWKSWQKIAAIMPIAVVDRPENTLKALSSRAALSMGRNRVFDRLKPAPSWIFISGLKNELSSTQLRRE